MLLVYLSASNLFTNFDKQSLDHKRTHAQFEAQYEVLAANGILSICGQSNIELCMAVNSYKPAFTLPATPTLGMGKGHEILKVLPK